MAEFEEDYDLVGQTNRQICRLGDIFGKLKGSRCAARRTSLTIQSGYIVPAYFDPAYSHFFLVLRLLGKSGNLYFDLGYIHTT